MKKLFKITLIVFIIPFIISADCDYYEDDNHIACFECKMPYIDTLCGSYKHNFSINNSPIPETIPDGDYYFEVTIYDCYFSGDCDEIFKSDCQPGYSDTPSSSIHSDDSVARYSSLITNNIGVFEKIVSKLENFPIYFSDDCTEDVHDRFDRSLRYKDDNNRTITVYLYIYYSTESPYCKPSNHPTIDILLTYSIDDSDIKNVIYSKTIQY